MKTKFKLIAFMLFACTLGNGYAQIPNSGFENWTDSVTYMTPVGWSCANYLSAGSFYPITRVADPYPVSVGNYCIRIENKPSLLPAYESKGFVWTNQYTDLQAKPAFPITGHPSSLTGYYKWLPQNGDTMYITVVLFQAGGIVGYGKMTSTVTKPNWTSFNIPFTTYTSADSATIILAAYDADYLYYIPYGNSVLYIDNLNFDTLISNSVPETVLHDPAFSLYPNPSNNNVTIDLSEKATIEIYTIDGRMIKIIAASSNNTNVDVSTLPNGIYIVQVKTEKGVGVSKFVKE